MKLDVKNTTGTNVGSIELDDAVFGGEIHEHILWEVVKWQLAKRRSGNASTKRIGEVRGSAKKVWKQKGTGQARQGSRQAPHFVGGGSVFGPKPRDYGYVIPRKVKRKALIAALSLRASQNKIIIVDAIALDGKTKSVAAALTALGAPQPTTKALIVDGFLKPATETTKAVANDTLIRGAKNLKSSQWLAPEGLNVYDILRHEVLVLTKAAAAQIQTAILGEKD
ncbi:MAG: 50S ribosomal protein L4 [Proteobacteria bacterium]|nr:50S ribosomal protein L4 [Pseudomonadota bacterium]